MSKFLVKERKPTGYYRQYGRSGQKWSAWRTVRSCDTRAEAVAEATKMQGLRQVAIFHEGKLVERVLS